MSYEKYIKYKTKYLNLKTLIHNQNIDKNNNLDFFTNEQTGGNNSFINSLGSSPETYVSENNSINSLGSSPKTYVSENNSSSSESINSQFGGLPIKKIKNEKHKKNKKNKKHKVFNDSEIDSSDSSLISFSSDINSSDFSSS